MEFMVVERSSSSTFNKKWSFYISNNLKFILISSVLYKPPSMLNMLLVAAAVLLVSMPKNSVFVKVVKHSEGFYPHLDFNSSFLPL